MSAETFRDLLAAAPYARFLGVEAHGDDGRTAVMRYAQHLIGNPLLPALHGGSVAAFMELTALAAVAAAAPRARPPKPVDVSVAYLRSGKPIDTFAHADLRKVGRRVAYVHVLAWQDDRTRPIAELGAHVLLAGATGVTSM
ncbi:PaaI family thioesterase [Brevundimonas sp.]|uniref:PaaI family thioesterase n=1 Tax=Brevundimonas sp. TaxID=1871086 RepID=UPI0026012B35|nr:PaaI family thioesterase [Brevundimonas sp.]